MKIEDLANDPNIKEKYDEAYCHVLKNLEDENTKATAKRKIIIEVVLTQDETREIVETNILVKESLVPRVMKAKSEYHEKQLEGQMSIEELEEAAEIAKDALEKIKENAENIENDKMAADSHVIDISRYEHK